MFKRNDGIGDNAIQNRFTALSEMLFSEYVKVWLNIAKNRVDIVTYEGYECLANSQVIPYFENMGIRLCDISKEVLQKYVDEKKFLWKIR